MAAFILILMSQNFCFAPHNIACLLCNDFFDRVQSKCQRKRRCWYCINRCDNCMQVAAIGLAKKTSGGVIVKFCSEPCSKEFDANPKVLNLLPAVFNITNDRGKITVLPPAGHKMLQRVTDNFDEDEEILAAVHTTRICVGNDSVEFPKDQVYILYEVSTVLRHTVAAFFITDDFSVLPLSTPPQECDIEVAMWFSKSIQHYVRPVLEAVVAQTSFSTFKAWCSAAVRGEESYFASMPYYENY